MVGEYGPSSNMLRLPSLDNFFRGLMIVIDRADSSLAADEFFMMVIRKSSQDVRIKLYKVLVKEKQKEN